MQHDFRVTPKHQAVEATPAMSSHEDQVGRPLFRFANNAIGRTTLEVIDDNDVCRGRMFPWHGFEMLDQFSTRRSVIVGVAKKNVVVV